MTSSSPERHDLERLQIEVGLVEAVEEHQPVRPGVDEAPRDVRQLAKAFGGGEAARLLWEAGFPRRSVQ